MPIGSVLARFSELTLSTADDKHFTLTNSIVSRLALRTIGLPHLGFRRRAGIIMSEARKLVDPSTVALDAGCGYGLYSMMLAECGAREIHSVDIDHARVSALAKMLGEAPALARAIKPETGSVTALPFKDGAFDLIICSEVIEHVAEHELAVRELARALKPGGTLLLSVPHDSAFQRRTYKRFAHERPGYSRQMLADMLGRHGVAIEQAFYYEYAPGVRLFDAFNAISSKPLMGLLFYPFYALYLLDSLLKLGEPSYIVIRARKSLPS